MIVQRYEFICDRCEEQFASEMTRLTPGLNVPFPATRHHTRYGMELCEPCRNVFDVAFSRAMQT